jgi:flagellar basal-body rod protein FlgB
MRVFYRRVAGGMKREFYAENGARSRSGKNCRLVALSGNSGDAKSRPYYANICLSQLSGWNVGVGTSVAKQAGMIDALFRSEDYLLARRMLDATVMRHQAIGANLANAETPGYKRVDLAPDFAKQLKAALERGGTSTQVQLPTLIEDLSARAVRPDGNNVEFEKELLALGQNNVDHAFLTQVISTNLRNLRTAIAGQSS